MNECLPLSQSDPEFNASKQAQLTAEQTSNPVALPGTSADGVSVDDLIMAVICGDQRAQDELYDREAAAILEMSLEEYRRWLQATFPSHK